MNMSKVDRQAEKVVQRLLAESAWKDTIKDFDEIKVFKALDGPGSTWRTVGGVARQTGMSAERVLQIITKYRARLTLIHDVPSASGYPLVGLLDKVGADEDE